MATLAGVLFMFTADLFVAGTAVRVEPRAQSVGHRPKTSMSREY